MGVSFGNSMPIGGGAGSRLAVEPSQALDAFCQALLALPDAPQPLPQPEAVVTGLQMVREAALYQGPSGDGFWTVAFEPVAGSGGRLILRRDAADLEAGFQVDAGSLLHGMFYLSYNGQEQGFSLDWAATGWVLRKWQGQRQVEFPLPADAAVPWNADPHAGVDGLLGGAEPPAPEIQWYYLRDGATQGPIADGALRRLLPTLPPDTLVWNPGMPDWKGAGELRLAEPPAPPKPPAPPDAAPPGAGWELAVFAGPAVGHRYAVVARTRVGSGEDCHVRLPDPSAARVHALLMERPDGFWIADNRTDEGTFVNNVRVEGPKRLAAGDVIGVGDTDLVFRRAT
jgi:hypothetical protein